MTEPYGALAGGDLSTEIPGVGRSDEIGGMAAAVQVFKDGAAEKGKLEVEAVATRHLRNPERSRTEAERVAAAERQAEVVEGLASSLAQLAAGDLTCTLERAFAPEYERLRVDFNASLAALEQSMCAVSANTQAIRRAPARYRPHPTICRNAPSSRPRASKRPPPRSNRSPRR